MAFSFQASAAALARAIAVIAAAALIASCGGGGGDTTTVPEAGTAPTTSNLAYSPKGAYQGSADSTATITGTVDFADPDGDVTSWLLTVSDASGQIVDSLVEPLPDATGITSGTLVATLVVGTAEIGDFTFSIEFIDAKGLRSAPLTGTFRVTESPWVSLPGLPLPRTGFATASLNGLVYVMGGLDPASGTIPAPPIARVDVYDPATGIWTEGTPMARPMSGFVASAAGGRIVAVGPTDSFGLTVETQEFDPVAAAWTVRTAPAGQARSQGGALAAGRFYTIGGSAGGFDLAAAESFDPVMDSWRFDAPMPTARQRLTAVSVEIAGAPRILALGGYGTTHVPDGGYFRANEAYDPVGDTWTARAPMPVPVAGAAAAAFDGKVFVFGGDNVERAIDSVSRYDPDLDAWAPRTALPAPATGVKAEVVNRKIFLFTRSDIWVYAPDNDIW